MVIRELIRFLAPIALVLVAALLILGKACGYYGRYKEWVGGRKMAAEINKQTNMKVKENHAAADRLRHRQQERREAACVDVSEECLDERADALLGF